MTNIENTKTIVFAPHDDGSGAFAVLYRLARAMVNEADNRGFSLRIYFLNSSEALSGQEQLNGLVKGMNLKHSAWYIPTDNLIRLPKSLEKARVEGAKIPRILHTLVGPSWYRWPCELNEVRGNIPVKGREKRQNFELLNQGNTSRLKGNLLPPIQASAYDLTDDWWRKVDLGISMGVPQLHRFGRNYGFPSIEVGDWFFSVGLKGCMEKSGVSPWIIAGTQPILDIIQNDEFMAREYWGTLFQTPREVYRKHLASTPVLYNEMNGLLWTGDKPPDDMENWILAKELRRVLDADISNLRSTRVSRIACIVPGNTGVWTGILEKLKQQNGNPDVAIISIDRTTNEISLLEDGGKILENAKLFLNTVPVEERGLAVSRASDFGIARSAGGALSFITTQRPSAFINEPGHWLGDIQRIQCIEAGLCIGVSIDDFRLNPQGIIENLGVQLDEPKSPLVRITREAQKLIVGAELDLARYLFEMYR